MIKAKSGFRAFVLRSRRLTFNPSPTMAIVSRRVVKSLIAVI